MRVFKFFRGILKGPRVASITNTSDRLTRTPTTLIPIPPTLTTQETIHTFREGWRACEQNYDIWDCPYSRYDPNELELCRNWEYGYTECFTRRREQSDEYVYMTGWESARAGYPLNQNPHTYGSNEFNMWYIGWNDFVDNH